MSAAPMRLDGDNQQIKPSLVMWNYFSKLGASPAVGPFLALLASFPMNHLAGFRNPPHAVRPPGFDYEQVFAYKAKHRRSWVYIGWRANLFRKFQSRLRLLLGVASLSRILHRAIYGISGLGPDQLFSGSGIVWRARCSRLDAHQRAFNLKVAAFLRWE